MRILRKLTIFVLLIAALCTFAYARREMFFQQAKKLIQQNLEKRFPCKVSIGSLRAGFVYGVIVEDLKLEFPKDSSLTVQIDQAFLDYNLWSRVFKRARKPSSDEVKEIALNLQGGKLSIGGKEPILKELQGRIVLEDKVLYFQDITASLVNNPQETFKGYGELSQDHLSLTVALNHLKLGEFDILTNFSLDANRKSSSLSEAGKIYGVFRSYGSVLNERPFPELSSFFEIKDKELHIFSFTLGDSYDLRGVANLEKPYKLDLSLNFYQAALNELVAHFTLSGPPDFSGLVNGFIRITGELPRPWVEGYIEAGKGHVGKLDFVSTEINLKGRYPRIELVDSHIWREETSFILEGGMDFSTQEIGPVNFVDIDLIPDKSLVWQGWGVSRGAQDQFHASKNIADDIRITFDSLIETDNRSDFGSDYTNELGLEYNFHGDKAIKLRIRGDEEILGIERRMRF